MAAPLTLTEKLLRAHLVSGKAEAGGLSSVRVDSVLFHDMSGILALMAYDTMGMRRAGVEAPTVFTDHNLVGAQAQTAGDQAFVKSCAKAFGLRFARAGSGICHTLYAEDIARPGMLLIGADSHTASCGALGMLGIGMGGMEVSAAMTGRPFPLRVPRVITVRLTGRLRAGVSAMDAALTLLSRLTIKGAVNAVLEYCGDGAETLTVPERQTLCNLGAEMGATSSVFPADGQALAWLKGHGREEDFMPMSADAGAAGSEEVCLDLGEVVPMTALPGQPDRGIPVREAEKVPFSQVFIGSCANGDYESLARAARVLKGRSVSPDTELLVACGSRKVYRQLMRDGWLDVILASGGRLLESGCGPCMGIGQAPASGTNVLRTTNRNFPGRAGTKDARIWLAGPLTAAASAVRGCLTDVSNLMDPRELEDIRTPEQTESDPSAYIRFDRDRDEGFRPVYTDKIRPIPRGRPLPDEMLLPVSLKAGDGISTDDIVPAVPEALSLRANIPALARYLFHYRDPGFVRRAGELKESAIAAGRDYAQGSSREHAAAGCLALGIRAVLAVSMHRIHRANLINYGILPLLIDRAEDLETIGEGDILRLRGIHEGIRCGHITVLNETHGISIPCHTDLNAHEAQVLLSGGLLNAGGGTENEPC
ncbi:MAG: aconitate hydratase [Clostridia bacterium]|nr:aconitate hydratase [Clostridia bacterium]